jgi:hypothetical protein
MPCPSGWTLCRCWPGDAVPEQVDWLWPGDAVPERVDALPALACRCRARAGGLTLARRCRARAGGRSAGVGLPMPCPSGLTLCRRWPADAVPERVDALPALACRSVPEQAMAPPAPARRYRARAGGRSDIAAVQAHASSADVASSALLAFRERGSFERPFGTQRGLTPG